MLDGINIQDRIILRLLEVKRLHSPLVKKQLKRYDKLFKMYPDSDIGLYAAEVDRIVYERGYLEKYGYTFAVDEAGGVSTVLDGGPRGEALTKVGEAAISMGILESETEESRRTKCIAIWAIVISAISLIISAVALCKD